MNLKDVLELLIETFEERILDGHCGKLGMKWDAYQRKIHLEKWVPDEDYNYHQLNKTNLRIYREAVKKYIKLGGHWMMAKELFGKQP